MTQQAVLCLLSTSQANKVVNDAYLNRSSRALFNTLFFIIITHTDRTVNVCFILPASSTNVKRPFFSVFYCFTRNRRVVRGTASTEITFTLNGILFILQLLPILAFTSIAINSF